MDNKQRFGGMFSGSYAGVDPSNVPGMSIIFHYQPINLALHHRQPKSGALGLMQSYIFVRKYTGTGVKKMTDGR